MMRLLVFGAGGMTGWEIEHRALAHGFHCTALTRAEADISDAAAVMEAVTRAKPDVVINAAAYTAVDKAEGDRDSAMRINAAGAVGRHAGERHHPGGIPHHQPVRRMPDQGRLSHLRRKIQGGDYPRPERCITQAPVDQNRRSAQVPHDGPAMSQKGPPEWRWIGNAYRNTLRHPSHLVTHLSEVE